MAGRERERRREREGEGPARRRRRSRRRRLSCYDPDPFAEIKRPSLRFNDFEEYVQPLRSWDMIRPRPLPPPEDHLPYPGEAESRGAGRREADAGAAEDAVYPDQAAWRRAREAGPGAAGLHTIDLARREPAVDTERMRREREQQARAWKVRRASDADLRAIRVRAPPQGTTSDLRRLRRQRMRDLEGIEVSALDLPPEAVPCGWSEYQGGATWEDLNRFRESEMADLRRIIRIQRLSPAQPIYYYTD
jgi:hypothetical protein